MRWPWCVARSIALVFLTDDLLQKDYYDNGLLLRDAHVNTRDAVRTAVDYLASVVDGDPQNTAELALVLKNVVTQL